MVPTLHAVSKSIWEWCFAHHCLLESYRIPGRSNLRANFLYRNHNRNLGWKLHRSAFLWVSQSPFVPDIDLFTSRLNIQIKTYVSWSSYPGAWAVDAFSVCWEISFLIISLLSGFWGKFFPSSIFFSGLIRSSHHFT